MDKYYVQYWEFDKPGIVHEDAFATLEEAETFYNEILDNNESQDACLLSEEDRDVLRLTAGK